MRILAIDPGNIYSGWVILDAHTRKPTSFGKDLNERVLELIAQTEYDTVAIEMIASYGMAVGREVFDTCVWIGRFYQSVATTTGIDPTLTYRKTVKQHHCHTQTAKDMNVRIALVDRFAPGAKNYGKGTKKEPGWFYGFHADVWQAYALGVQHADENDPLRLATLNAPHVLSGVSA